MTGIIGRSACLIQQVELPIDLGCGGAPALLGKTQGGTFVRDLVPCISQISFDLGELGAEPVALVLTIDPTSIGGAQPRSTDE